MDPNRIIQALKGTIDPNLRIAAENELNQVGDLKKLVVCCLFLREASIMDRFGPENMPVVMEEGRPCVLQLFGSSSAW